MAALVLGALTQVGDRTPWLAAILADRYRAPGRVIAGAAIAIAANNAVGAAGAMLLAPLLTPNARLLLLALALALAAIVFRPSRKGPDRLEGWRLGSFGTATIGLAILAFGDRMQFVTAALAVRSPVPWLAPVGATFGAMAVCVPAILIGERRWLALPLAPVRIAASVILAIAAIILALVALRLL